MKHVQPASTGWGYEILLGQAVVFSLGSSPVMTVGSLPVTSMADSVDVLLSGIDFTSKGLSQPRVIQYDPAVRRIVLKAIYHGPRAGWPLLDRRTIEKIAGKKEPSVGKPKVPICLSEIAGGAIFPLPVVITIALLQPGLSADTYLQPIQPYAQVYVNDYRPFRLPVAFWRAAEGIWIVVRDEGGMGLLDWWGEHVRPKIEESETRYKVGSWRRSPSLVGSVQMESQAGSQGEDEAMEEKAGTEEAEVEEESISIDRGWLGAVNILIQMADILLVSCRPGFCFIRVYPSTIAVTSRTPRLIARVSPGIL